MAQQEKNPPAMQKIQVWSLHQEDPLEKEMATHYSILAWKSHGQRTLVCYNPKCRKESDKTEQLSKQAWVANEENFWELLLLSVQFSSATQSCPALCDPMNCSTLDLPVHHQLPEITQTCPSSQWCHPAISSSVVPFSSYPQSLPASESFPMSQLLAFQL